MRTRRTPSQIYADALCDLHDLDTLLAHIAALDAASQDLIRSRGLSMCRDQDVDWETVSTPSYLMF